MTVPLRYFALIFLLSVPFWILGAVVTELPIPINLPISALGAFMPAVAALIFVYREKGVDGAKALLARIADWRRIPSARWLLAALVFWPATLALAWILMRLAGAALPEPHIALAALPVFFLMFFVGAIGEELGWQGYIYDRMEGRWSALAASLLLGLVWALWHTVPYIQTRHDAQWIVWHSLVTVLLRVVTVWLYVNAGRSVFAVLLFHTMCNVAYYLFPNYGSHYDPVYAFLILAPATAALVWLWGPRTLATFRYARPVGA